MTTVFTNGVFDIIHSGHVSLLSYAKSQGDKLIVGINSDESAKRMKGPTRPIFTQEQRKNILQSFRFVDEVRIFEEDTPELLIREINPGILVKGPEAIKENIPGAEFVIENKGKVLIPDLVVDVSTTHIIKQVLVNNCCNLSWMCEISIGGLPVDLARCSISFYKPGPDGWRPVLYYKGQRVIEAWSVHLSHNQPKDIHGRSA